MVKRDLIAVVILRHGQVVQSIRFRHANVIYCDPIHVIEAFNKWGTMIVLKFVRHVSYLTNGESLMDHCARCLYPAKRQANDDFG